MKQRNKKVVSLGPVTVTIGDIRKQQSKELRKASHGLSSIEHKLPSIQSQDNKPIVLINHEH